jgi:nucleotide-binding universal stress UspA family protein
VCDVSNNLHSSGVTRVVPALLLGNPVRETVNFAKEKKVDMIIVGHNGSFRRKEVYARRVARKVSRSTGCTYVRVN